MCPYPLGPSSMMPPVPSSLPAWILWRPPSWQDQSQVGSLDLGSLAYTDKLDTLAWGPARQRQALVLLLRPPQCVGEGWMGSERVEHPTVLVHCYLLFPPHCDTSLSGLNLASNKACPGQSTINNAPSAGQVKAR